MQEMQSKYWTVDEIAETLRVNPQTIRRYLQSGKLNGVRLQGCWRISDADLQNFIENRTKKKNKPLYIHNGKKN